MKFGRPEDVHERVERLERELRRERKARAELARRVAALEAASVQAST